MNLQGTSVSAECDGHKCVGTSSTSKPIRQSVAEALRDLAECMETHGCDDEAAELREAADEWDPQ